MYTCFIYRYFAFCCCRSLVPHSFFPSLSSPSSGPCLSPRIQQGEEGNGCWASCTESSGGLILLSLTFLLLLLNVGFITEDGATEISECWIVSHKAPLRVPWLGSQLSLLIQLDTLASRGLGSVRGSEEDKGPGAYRLTDSRRT